MIEPAITLGGKDDTPPVRIIVNRRYVLYHYLVAQGQLPIEQRRPSTAEAAGKAERARHLGGVHGIWDDWERPLAEGETVDTAVAGLRSALTGTVNDLSTALREAEPRFLAEIWPQRQEAIDSALTTHAGLTLVETFLHEATHVADVKSNELGRQTLGTRLQYALTAAGMSSATAWNVWHAIIFTASAAQVRACVNAHYTDHATVHELYSWFGVPKLPTLWSAFTGGTLGEEELLRAVTEEVRSSE